MLEHDLNDSPSRVVLIEPSGSGGLAHFVFELARALADSGARVTLLTGAEYELDGRDRRFEVRGVFSRLRTNPLRVASTLRDLAPDVVHIHGAAHPEFYVPLVLLVRAFGFPVVYSAHDTVPRQRPRYTRSLVRLLLSLPERVIAHSRAVASEIESQFLVSPSRIDVVPHGHYVFLADYAAPHDAGGDPTNDNEARVLFFGYILPQKGLLDLIDAFRIVVDSLPHALLCIAGTPVGSFDPYAERIRALGLEENVELTLGYIPLEDLPNFFTAANVVALPYHAASQSGVLMAAYGFGTPVVATNCPGLVEYIQAGVTGLIVPPRDIEAFAAALIELLEDRQRSEKMGRAAMDWSLAEVPWSRVADQTLLSYASAVAS